MTLDPQDDVKALATSNPESPHKEWADDKDADAQHKDNATGYATYTSDPVCYVDTATPEPRQPSESKDKTPHPNRIRPTRKVYQPKLSSTYVDPDYLPDTAESLDILFQEHGKSLWTDTEPLPPRDDSDILKFSKEDEAELDRNLKWEGCPREFRPHILHIIKRWWDLFTKKGLQKPIRGFSFHVDTGDVAPVCCKVQQYGRHEMAIIERLCQRLKDNGMVQRDTGPWGALIVLAAKPGQDHVPWWEFIWRLCVSYRHLNRVTRPFRFPFRRCDEAVLAIETAKYRISIDMDSGYWQIPVEPQSRPKLAFFTPSEKLTWTTMPMGALNAPVFAAMMQQLQTIW